MPLDTPPQESTARSASTHSMTVLERMEAVSCGAKPSASRPAAISRTASAAWFQVQVRQMPRSFWRSQTLAPRCATAFQNMAGRVSPARTTRVSGWMWARSQSFLTASSPCLLLLPPPLPPHPHLLHPQVELLDVFLLAQPRAGVFHHDAPGLQHVAVVRDVQGHVGVLLHQQDGGAALAVDAHHDLEDLARQLGREPQARFVQEDQVRR